MFSGGLSLVWRLKWVALLLGLYGFLVVNANWAHSRAEKAQAKVASLERAADEAAQRQQAMQNAWQASQAALSTLSTQTQALEQAHAQLSATHQRLISQRIPRLVRVAGAAPAHALCAVPSLVQGLGPQPTPVAAPHTTEPGAPAAPAVAQGPTGDPDIQLSLGAVWLWNTALSGQPTDVGACNPAGRTSEPDTACAQASGLSIDDALANHAANAKSCTADRQRLSALIDFIQARQTQGAAP